MATTVDRTIEMFELVDRYTDRLQRMSRHTDSFARKVKEVQMAVGKFALGAAGALGAGIVALGTHAVQTAAKFEQFQVTLEVLTGSAQKAQEKLAFIRRLAIPSTFTFQELAEAGTQLEAFRVPLEKALPLIAKLGAAFPNKELQDFVNLFGRLGSGDFPDLEALSGAGLSRLDFIRKGIKFDSQGSLLSSSRETMDALEKIINERYGNILNRIANTTTSKLATVRDKWEQNLKKIGDALVRFVNPILDKIGLFLDRLNKDDNFNKWLQNIARGVLKFTKIMFETLGNLLLVVSLVRFAFRDFAGGTLTFLAALASFVGGAKVMRELAFLFKDIEKANAAGSPPIDVPVTPPGIEFPDNPATKTLNNIEANTRQTAVNTRQALDLRKFALGGGEIGALGITPIERFRGGPNRRNLNLNIQGGRDALSRAIAEIARQVYEQEDIRRNGGR